MLFAALLKKFDGPIDASSADKAAEFYQELNDKAVYGVATGYSATIVEAIKAQLDIGIDTTARARLAAIGEEPASPPGTDQRPRVRARGARPRAGWHSLAGAHALERWRRVRGIVGAHGRARHWSLLRPHLLLDAVDGRRRLRGPLLTRRLKRSCCVPDSEPCTAVNMFSSE